MKRSKMLNPGIEAVKNRGSKILTESYHTSPAISLTIAAGVIKHVTDKNKPFITVINSYTTHIP